MARTKLSTLRTRVAAGPLRMEAEWFNLGTSSARHELSFVAPNGRTLFTAHVDDLFDADGNRFEDDLP